MKKSYLIWDFDGTLGYRLEGWTGALLTLLQRHAPQITVSLDQVRSYLRGGFPWHAPENAHPGLSETAWWQELEPVFARAFRAVGMDREEALVLAQEVRAVYVDSSYWKLFPDTLPALDALAGLGWRHILLSNHVPELPALIGSLGLSGYFQAVCNSAQTGYEKPHPGAFRAVLAEMEPESRAWMIGDSYTADILGAREAGLPGILVRRLHPEATFYCDDLTGIVPILTKANYP